MKAKCKICKEPATQRFGMTYACGYEHAAEAARAKQETKQRKELREAKVRIKTRQQWLKEAERAFNAYIRERDSHLPCISCGRSHLGQWHAGHYRSVGSAPELRFHEWNVQKQCAPCNNHLSGNAIEYRLGLIARLGVWAVEWLEGPHEPKKYTIDDAKAIKAEYVAKLKQLKAERGL